MIILLFPSIEKYLLFLCVCVCVYLAVTRKYVIKFKWHIMHFYINRKIISLIMYIWEELLY